MPDDEMQHLPHQEAYSSPSRHNDCFAQFSAHRLYVCVSNYHLTFLEQRHLRPCSAVLFKRFTPSYICIQIFNTLFVSITVCSFFFYCSCVFHFCVALHFIYNVFQVVHLFTPPTPLSQIFKTSFTFFLSFHHRIITNPVYSNSQKTFSFLYRFSFS